MQRSGGIGGAKLAEGLYRGLPGRPVAIGNTGDDAEMYGLRACPDLDAVRLDLDAPDDLVMARADGLG